MFIIGIFPNQDVDYEIVNNDNSIGVIYLLNADHYVSRLDIIYSSSNNNDLIDEIIKCWNDFLNANGMKEIFLVEYISTKNKNVHSKFTNSIIEFEPLYTTYFDISFWNFCKRFICKKMKITDFQSYDKLWKYIINRKRVYSGVAIIKSCFSGFDNSPRKGKNSLIIKGATSQKFGNYLEQLINVQRKDTLNDWIVINAWNEWGEGAILEPTKNEGYAYLNEVKRIKEKMK